MPTSFHVTPDHRPLLRRIGLTADGVFTDPRVVPWRALPDRENCTLDVPGEGVGTPPVRLHVKRYRTPAGAGAVAAEVRGYELLTARRIPTAPLAFHGTLPDGRSFTAWADLTGYTPADKLLDAGAVAFDQLLEPTADLAARLHAAGLHHRDLYLCHFMAKTAQDGSEAAAIDDLRLIDVARVARLRNVFTRRRWIVKDLAQFWYSTTKLPVTDRQREEWLARYATQRGDGTTAVSLRGAIERKARRIARHDRNLNAAQPTRNISIPDARAFGARVDVDPSLASAARPEPGPPGRR